MKITSITAQVRNQNRANISVDGKYRFSLDIFQIVELGIKVGSEYDEKELVSLEQESQFGKIYSRALEYCLVRPRSLKEVKDYLYRKTIPTRNKLGEIKNGVSPNMTGKVIDRLVEKGYIDDFKFANFWLENRQVSKGVSRRKLIAELMSKGVDGVIIDQALNESGRDDNSELKKVIAKKRNKYSDDKKLIAYLARLGFEYDDIKQALLKN